MARLTKGFIDKLQPPATGSEIHWDGTVKGYGLRVSAASEQYPNGKRVFFVMGRVNSKLVQFTVGAFGTYTEEQARKRAQSILQDMREGIDPREAKREDAAVKVTLAEVGADYVLRRDLKESSKRTIERHLKTTFATWASKAVASITEEDCRKRYRELASKGLRGNGPAPGQANQGFSVLRALINFAARQYKRADGSRIILYNPVEGLEDDWKQLKPRSTRIPDTKIGAVWHMLAESRLAAPNRDTLSAIDLVRFLMLTGARITEGGSLKWEDVSLDEGWMHFADPKNGNEIFLPLSSQAIEVLKQRPRMKGGAYIFSSSSVVGYVVDPRRTLSKVSEVAGLHLSAHDLRRTMTQIAIGICKIEKFKADLLTNHVGGRDVTAKHYLDTTHLQWLQPEAQQIGDWIEQQAAIASGANVVQLRA
jgi:integrase